MHKSFKLHIHSHKRKPFNMYMKACTIYSFFVCGFSFKKFLFFVRSFGLGFTIVSDIMRMQTNEAHTKNGSYSNDIWQGQFQRQHTRKKSMEKEDYLCVQRMRALMGTSIMQSQLRQTKKIIAWVAHKLTQKQNNNNMKYEHSIDICSRSYCHVN